MAHSAAMQDNRSDLQDPIPETQAESVAQPEMPSHQGTTTDHYGFGHRSVVELPAETLGSTIKRNLNPLDGILRNYHRAPRQYVPINAAHPSTQLVKVSAVTQEIAQAQNATIQNSKDQHQPTVDNTHVQAEYNQSSEPVQPPSDAPTPVYVSLSANPGAQVHSGKSIPACNSPADAYD